VYKIHPDLGNSPELSQIEIERLKKFLEINGSELTKYPELIPFFAIPYFKNLKEHQSFKHLFEKNWI